MDRHTSTEKSNSKSCNWEGETPVHLSRLWTDTPVEVQKPRCQKLVRDLQGKEEPKDRSLPEQKGPQTAEQGGQKRQQQQTKRKKGKREKGDPNMDSGGKGIEKSMSDFL